MDVIIISNYWHFPEEKASSRYHSIAVAACNAGLDTEVVTSSFYHTKKAQRGLIEDRTAQIPYKVTLVQENTYKRNVSLQRIFSHSQFASNVIKYLSGRKKPDVIYLFVPPAGLAEQVVRYANQNGIRVIIDVLDLWPEAFGMLMPQIAAKVLLAPMKKSVQYAYDHADHVVAVSDAYVQRALSGNPKAKTGHPVFIGTDLNVFDKAAENAPALEGKLRPVTMAYIGMLGHSYDLIGIMDAMRLLRDQGWDQAEFLVMGDGPLKEKFSEYARQYDLPVRFTGRLPYDEMAKKLVACDFGLNVLVGKAAQSIINKHADYISAGLPVVNIQKEQEFGNLLEQYEAGLMCQPGDVPALAEAIRKLADNESLRRRMGANSRRLAEEKFDRNKTYGEIVDLIKGVIE